MLTELLVKDIPDFAPIYNSNGDHIGFKVDSQLVGIESNGYIIFWNPRTMKHKEPHRGWDPQERYDIKDDVKSWLREHNLDSAWWFPYSDVVKFCIDSRQPRIIHVSMDSGPGSSITEDRITLPEIKIIINTSQ